MRTRDPNNIDRRDGFQYDYATSGSGIGNVFVNAKWLFKLSGMYQLPFDVQRVGVLQRAAGLSVRAGILVPTNLPNGGGTADDAAGHVGENRLPTFQNFDFHFERPISFGTRHFVPSVDIFNLANNNTIQAHARQQNATNANQHPGDRRAARHPLRSARELVESRRRRRADPVTTTVLPGAGGGPKGPPLLSR